MRLLSRYILSLTFALALASCASVADPDAVPGAASLVPAASTRSPKILGEPVDCDPGELLFKVSAPLDEAQIDALAADGITGVRPALRSPKGDDALFRRFGLDRWYVADALQGALETAAERLAVIGKVNIVQFNSLVHKPEGTAFPSMSEPVSVPTRAVESSIPFNDPYAVQQWGLLNKGDTSMDDNAYKGGDINIVDAWRTLSTGDPDIIVAVMDEGVKYSHPDLKANMWVNKAELNGAVGVDDDGNGYIDDVYGYNFVDDGAISWTKEKDVSHGSHCAGIIAAVNNNGIGVCSVAGGDGTPGSGVKIMSVQIFSGDKTANDRQTAAGYVYAADNGASVVSCSFGYKGGAFTSDNGYMAKHQITVDALRYFEAKKNNVVLDGGVAIFASGNDALNYAEYPGAIADVISVSAYGVNYLPASYTNYGPGCNIVAPGGDAQTAKSWPALICSTVNSETDGADYGYMQGTSMACPFVSGVAALGLSYAKKLGKTFTRWRFTEMLVTSAIEFDSRLSGKYMKYKHLMGTGGVDTWTFMMQIEGIPSTTLVAGQTQFVDLSPFFGTASKSLTYLRVEMSDVDKAALGIETNPSIQYGKLKINPTKVGSGKLKITAVAGGSEVGGGDKVGGMEVTQEISLVSRYFKSSNGGWL